MRWSRAARLPTPACPLPALGPARAEAESNHFIFLYIYIFSSLSHLCCKGGVWVRQAGLGEGEAADPGGETQHGCCGGRDGRMEGGMDGWMEGWTDGGKDGRMEGRMDGWMDGGASSHPSSPPCPSAASPQPGRGLLASEQGVPRARGSSCPKPCPCPSRSQIYLRHGARPSEAPARPAAARGRGVLAWFWWGLSSTRSLRELQRDGAQGNQYSRLHTVLMG